LRKLLVSLAAAGSLMTLASPASAQWHRSGPGYSQGAHYQDELQNLRVQMDNLGRSGRLTGRESRDLYNDIRGTQDMVLRANRGGIQPWQARNIEQRITHIRYELRQYSDYDGRHGWHNGRRY
jgi:hypothetical protein